MTPERASIMLWAAVAFDFYGLCLAGVARLFRVGKGTR